MEAPGAQSGLCRSMYCRNGEASEFRAQLGARSRARSKERG